MSETSIFGKGRILPTLQPYTTIHRASPPVAPQTAWRTGRDSHLCCDLLDLSCRKTWVFDSAWFDCGFITSHGCYPLLATLTYLKFQLDAQLPLANKDVAMLETPLQIFDTMERSFSEQFCCHTGHVAWEMLPVWNSVNLRRTPKPCLGVQLYVAISIYVYNIYINKYIHICISYHIIYIYHIYKYISIYIYIIYYILYDCRSYTYPNLWRFESDGYTKFSSWTAPKCRISFRFTRNNPGPPSCSYHWLSVSIQLCPMWLGGSSPLSKTIPLWPFPPFIGGFSKSIMVTADPHDSSSTHGNFRISTADHLFLGLKIVTVPSNIWG